MAWRQFDEVVATFRPRVLHTLRPEAVDWIGWRGSWLAAWSIEEEDGGPYVGQMAWTPFVRMSTAPMFPCSWVPTEDLVDIKLVARADV